MDWQQAVKAMYNMFDALEGLEFNKRPEWITFKCRVVILLQSICPEMLKKSESKSFKAREWIRKVEEEEGAKTRGC